MFDEQKAKTQVALQIWDIGGQSIGSKMITSYIAGAHVRHCMIVIVVFALFCHTSLLLSPLLSVVFLHHTTGHSLLL